MRIVLAGATGLTGALLLERLLADPRVEDVTTLARRTIDHASPKLVQLTGPIDEWGGLLADSKPDVVISTLGTTLRTAGSESAFTAVDHGAVVCLARSGRAAGARQFMLVSAVGAHPSSRNFYLSVKGRAEADVQAVGYDRFDIFRPGLLRGGRRSDFRIGEQIALAISPLTDLLTPRVLDHFRSIAAADVAEAIASLSGNPETGMHIHDNRAMWNAIGRS